MCEDLDRLRAELEELRRLVVLLRNAVAALALALPADQAGEVLQELIKFEEGPADDRTNEAPGPGD